MKIAVFSDLHLHEFTYGSWILPSGENSRLYEQRGVLDEIFFECRNKNIKHILFCGDLFHKPTVTAPVLTIACRTFYTWAKQGMQMAFLVGNHDQKDKAGKWHCLDWLRPVARVVDAADRWDWYGQGFSALPYTENPNVLNHFFNNKVKEGDVVALHQGVAGVPMGSGYVINEILNPAAIPSKVKHVFTGHYHTHRRVNDKLTVVGSPMQHNWGDRGDKRGFVIYDTLTNEVTLNELDAPEFMELSPSQALRVDISRNYIRIVGCPIEKQEELKYQVERRNAAVVEFALPEVNLVGSPAPVSYNNFDIAPILEKFEKDISEERKAIGQRLRDSKYAPPTV